MSAPVLVLHPSATPHGIGLRLEYGTGGFAHGWALWAVSGCCDAYMHWDYEIPPAPYCSNCVTKARDSVPAQSSYFRLLGAQPVALSAWAANWTGLTDIHVDVCIPAS